MISYTIKLLKSSTYRYPIQLFIHQKSYQLYHCFPEHCFHSVHSTVPHVYSLLSGCMQNTCFACVICCDYCLIYNVSPDHLQIRVNNKSMLLSLHQKYSFGSQGIQLDKDSLLTITSTLAIMSFLVSLVLDFPFL